MNKKLYKPLTVFVHQFSSKQLQTPIWQIRCKKGKELIRGLPENIYEHWVVFLRSSLNTFQLKMSERSNDYHWLEPMEEKALHYAASIRFFCLPWTLAISRDEAEECLVSAYDLAAYIRENFKIKVKLVP